MALLTGNLHSNTLSMETQLSVILPQDRCEAGAPYRLLYLLHGLGDNATAWLRYSQVELMLQRQNVIVVMPEVQRSFYCDMSLGSAYFTYITEELPVFVRRSFCVSDRREDVFVFGLSMGGFGALKCGLTRPDLYGGCASFSGAVSMDFVLETAQGTARLENQIQAVLGPHRSIGPENDLPELARKAAALPPEKRPRVFATCGLSDGLLGCNRAFADRMRALPLDFTYQEWDGDHTWPFWDQSLGKALKYFMNIEDFTL